MTGQRFTREGSFTYDMQLLNKLKDKVQQLIDAKELPMHIRHFDARSFIVSLDREDNAYIKPKSITHQVQSLIADLEPHKVVDIDLDIFRKRTGDTPVEPHNVRTAVSKYGKKLGRTYKVHEMRSRKIRIHRVN
jgi:hypothetical protein